MAKCPHTDCSFRSPYQKYSCLLCTETGEVPTAVAVEYVLLDLNDIGTWSAWNEQVKQLLERHK